MTPSSEFKRLEEQLQSLASPGIRPGLARLSKLLQLAGNPERKFPAVHVVGTNGKGSTAATLDSILRAAGYKTALYTSPHLVSFGERLLVNGEEVTPDKWLGRTSQLEKLIKNCPRLIDDRPTYFELITAAAFMILAEEDVDIAIVEAGMGGRLDATNILKHVLLTLIAPIGLDHTEYLGGTLLEVAGEKFAVMRPNVPAIFAGGDDSVNEEFLNKAHSVGAHAKLMQQHCDVTCVNVSLKGTEFRVESEGLSLDYRTPLIGTFQADNAALAVMGAKELQRAGYDKIDIRATEAGVEETKWQGRFEVVRDKPLLILDGGHNAHAMKRIAETVSLAGINNLSLVLAMMKDKDVSDVISIIRRIDSVVYCTEVPEMARCMSAHELYEKSVSNKLTTAGEWKYPIDAINDASRHGRAVLCCGSLYLVGYIKEHIEQLY